MSTNAEDSLKLKGMVMDLQFEDNIRCIVKVQYLMLELPLVSQKYLKRKGTFEDSKTGNIFKSSRKFQDICIPHYK